MSEATIVVLKLAQFSEHLINRTVAKVVPELSLIQRTTNSLQDLLARSKAINVSDFMRLSNFPTA
jgi:hypothetical protein